MKINLKPVFYDATKIGEVCCLDPRKIGYYVEHYGLPAFKEKTGKNAKWKARPESLEKWAKEHEKKLLKNSCQ